MTYMRIPAFEMPTIRRMQKIIQQGAYGFFIDLEVLICIFLLNVIHIFYILFGKINFISGSFCELDLLWFFEFSLHLPNPYFSFAKGRIFSIIYLNDILVLIFFKHVGK